MKINKKIKIIKWDKKKKKKKETGTFGSLFSRQPEQVSILQNAELWPSTQANKRETMMNFNEIPSDILNRLLVSWYGMVWYGMVWNGIILD